MKVLVDMDGVIINILGAVQSAIPSFDPARVVDYNFHCDLGVPREDVIAALYDPALMEVAKPYVGAVDGLIKLRNAGVEVYAYTGVIADSKSIRDNQIDSLGLLGEAYSSNDKPANFEGFDAVFEDNPSVLDRWTNATERYIIDRPYNRGYSRAVRCSSFYEAAICFLKKHLDS